MGDNILHITDLGLQASLNAEAGGILVNVVSFKLGDSDRAHVDSDIDIHGLALAQGSIHHVEVLSQQSVRFVFDIPGSAIPEDGFVGREVGLFTELNTMYARCVFEDPYVFREGEGTRIHAVMTTTRCDLATINVTLGDYTSIPSTPNVWRLPVPDQSEFNAISVLDCLRNVDGTNSPGFAFKYGEGAMQWAFTQHDRVYSGLPDPGQVSPTTFKASALTTSMTFSNGEIVIMYVAAGNARGETRKFAYQSGTDSFSEVDSKPIQNLDDQCTVVVWRRISSGNASSNYPPNMAGIPPDWVLTRGVGNLPVWAPPKSSGKNMNTLYESPGRLRVTNLNYTGSGQESRYTTGGILVKNVNYCVTAVGGITQHRTAFDINGAELEYAENIPTNAPIDIRLFTKEPGVGSRTEILTDAFISDGSQVAFPLSQPIDSAAYAMVYIAGVLQSTSTYTYDSVQQTIVMSGSIPEGVEIEISSLRLVQDENYSTRIRTTTLITFGETLFIELPSVPQSKNNTFLSVSGTHIHRDLYTIVDNKIVLSSPISPNLEVEVMVFENVISEGTPQSNLKGVVVDALLTHKALKLIRHDAEPVSLMIPSVSLRSGRGIRVGGIYPNYIIESTVAQQLNSSPAFKYHFMRRQEDTEEIILTQRINISGDMRIQVTANFSAILGPGFVSPYGLETMQYSVGYRTTGAKEPEYGRDIQGTGEAGFSSLQPDSIQANADVKAHSNASLTTAYSLVKNNIPSGYIEIVARMRVRSASINQYGSKLIVHLSVLGDPILGG